MNKKISSNHYANDWPAELDNIDSQLWEVGIEIIRSRFQSRYFNPLNHIIDSKDKSIRTNCGFLVMSIDCLLIETLNQFYLGIYNTKEKYFSRNLDADYRYDSQAFRDFFLHSTFFPDFKNNTSLYDVFYKEIRCGLLHQAESKTSSLINLKINSIVVPLDESDITKGIIINRALFHQALTSEFEKYLEDLRQPNSVNIFGENLREKCNRRMAELCR